MFELSDYVIIALLGSIGAFISGLLGVGGGVIFIPILDYYIVKAGIQGSELVKFTLANSFFVIVFSGIVISIKQYKSGNFYPKQVFFTALPGVLSSFLVTYLILSGNWYQQHMFKTLFLLMLIPMTIRMFSQKEKAINSDVVFPSYLLFSITGFFTGIITSLSGLGGGILMVPVFSDFLKLPIKIATSISTGVIPIFTAVLIIPYMMAYPEVINQFQIGYIVFPIVAPLIISVMVISPTGVKVAHMLKPFHLRIIFACVSSIIILKELYGFIK
jgi:uncharacterized membrane protein YfcA